MGADQSLPEDLPERSPAPSPVASPRMSPPSPPPAAAPAAPAASGDSLEPPERATSFARQARTRGGTSGDASTLMKSAIEQRYKKGGAARRLLRAARGKDKGDEAAKAAKGAGEESLLQQRLNFWQHMERVVGSDQSGAAAVAPADPSEAAPKAAPSDDDDDDGDNPRRPEPSVSVMEADRPRAAQMADEERRASKRERVVREIVESEQLYSNFLQLMLEKFLIPIRERGVLSAADVSLMFANSETFAPYHELFAASLAGPDGVVGAFSKYVHYLKMYVPYVNNYDAAMDTMGRLKKDKKFQAFLAEKRRDTELGGLDLTSFLIMPIQRIPRYRMLLDQLLKFTDDAHPDKAELQRSLALVTEIADKVNATKREFEHLTRLLEVHNRIQGCMEFDLIQPHRRLLRESPMLRKKKSSKEAHVFLFNDLLLWTTPAPSHDFKGVIRLAAASVAEYKHKNKTGFRVVCQNMPDDLVLVQADAAERDSWAASIADAIEGAKEARKARRELNNSSSGRAASHHDRRKTASMIQQSLRGLNGTLRTRLAAMNTEDDVTYASATLTTPLDPESTEYKEAMAAGAAVPEADSDGEDGGGGGGGKGKKKKAAAGGEAKGKPKVGGRDGKSSTLSRTRPKPPQPKGPRPKARPSPAKK